MAKRSHLCFIFLTILLSACLSVFANPITSHTLIQDATLFGSWDDLQMKATMIIETPRTTARERLVQVFMKNESSVSRLLMEILTPVSLRNLKFLSISDTTGLSQWLNTSRGPRRIPSVSRPEPIFDSDFYSTDFIPFSPEDYTITELGLVVILDQTAQQFRLIPKNGSVQGIKTISIEPQSKILLRVEFEEVGNSPFRTMEVTNLTQNVNGIEPREIIMQSPSRGTRTTLRIESLTTIQRIAESIFSRASW